MKVDEGCWLPVEGNPINRGKSEILWRINVFPCQVNINELFSSANLLIKSYQIRLGIETEECVEYIYSDKTIGPRSVDDMVTSGYRPEPPTDLNVHNMPGDQLIMKTTFLSACPRC